MPDSQIHFIELPFYETGTIEKKPIGKEDIQITIDLIKKVQPHQIYAAGDLANLHETHKVRLDAVFEAVKNLKSKDFMKDCWVQVLTKRHGIFKHQY